jgi:phospholipid/cholesterol/gamma-HCH transport system substrate-binding protein
MLPLVFPNAAGIDVGAPITLHGVRKGAVTALEVRPDGVRITALVENSVPLKRDARAEIQMLEVTGGKKIEIFPGSSNELLAQGAVVPGAVQGDITALLADVGEITASTKIVVRRVDSALVYVNDLIGSRTFRNRIDNTLGNLESTSAAARDLVAGNRGKIDRMIATFDDLSGDLRDLVNHSRPAVDRALASVDTISADARVALHRLDLVLQHSDTLISRVDDIARQMRQGDGTVAKLLNDKGFADELENTLKSVRTLVENLDAGKTRIPLKIGF